MQITNMLLTVAVVILGITSVIGGLNHMLLQERVSKLEMEKNTLAEWTKFLSSRSQALTNLPRDSVK